MSPCAPAARMRRAAGAARRRHYNRAVMPSRVFAFLLALVLLCSGFSGPVPVDAAGLAQGATVAAADSGPEPLTGAPMDEHHPVDVSAQPCAETLADGQQALLMVGAPAPMSGLRMARPRPYAAPARLAPYLDGPQRPPCTGANVA